MILILIMSLCGCKKEPKEREYKIVAFSSFINHIGEPTLYKSYEEMFDYYEDGSDKDLYMENVLKSLGKTLKIRDDYNLIFSGTLGAYEYKMRGIKTLLIDSKEELPIFKSFLLRNEAPIEAEMLTTISTTLDNGDDFFIKFDYSTNAEDFSNNENVNKPSIYKNDEIVGIYTIYKFAYYVNDEYDRVNGYGHVPYGEMFDIYDEGSEKDNYLESVLKCIGETITITKDYIIEFSGSLGAFEYKMIGDKSGIIIDDSYFKFFPIYSTFHKGWKNIIEVKDIILTNGDNLSLIIYYDFKMTK